MAKIKYINQMIPIFENCQKQMKDILGYFEETSYDGWRFMDLSKCNRPCIERSRKNRRYRYNMVEKIIYIEDIYHCVLEDLAAIFNIVKWQDWDNDGD